METGSAPKPSLLTKASSRRCQMIGFVGLDIGKDSFTAAFLWVDPQGQTHTRKPQTFSADQVGWHAFLACWRTLPPQTWHVGLESSGPYTLLYLHHLQSLPHPVHLISPLQAGHLRRSRSLRKTKTDSIDAETLAAWLFSAWQENRLPQQARTSSPLRDLATLYDQLTQEMTRVQNRFRQVLHLLFPELERRQRRFPKALRRLLQAFPSARHIAQASVEDLAPFCRRLSWTPDKLRALAATSWGVYDEAAIIHLRQLLALWDELETRRQQVWLDLRQQVRQRYPDAWKRLRTIPGLGERLTALFLALTGDLVEFPSPKALVAFTGLDPSVYQSGNFHAHGRLSKRGSPLLRHVLFLIAQALVRYTHRFRQTFLHHRQQQGRSYGEAMVIVARKALTIFHMLILRQRDFVDLAPQTLGL